jgi:g-D-glutamyl-meso-diaminopimelate peptidase
MAAPSKASETITPIITPDKTLEPGQTGPWPGATDTAQPLALTEGVTCRVKAEAYLSLRVSDSTKAVCITQLPRDELLMVLDVHEAFARVETQQGQRGYVLKSYLEVTGEPFDATDITEGDYTVICREFITLRQAPQVEDDDLGTLSPGSCVSVRSKSVNGFVKVYAPDLGAQGYVRLDYLTKGRVAQPEVSTVPADPENKNLFTVKCNQYVTLRAAPSQSAQALEQIANGGKVEVNGYEGMFARVEYGGQTGYVLSGYLQSGHDISGTFSVVKPMEAYSYTQMVKDCKALAKKYPDKVKLAYIGQSRQGRDIPVLILGRAGAKYQILIQAAMHGREHMTALLCMAQADALLKGGSLKKDICIHVVPMSNPDGVVISQDHQMTEALERIYQNDKTAGYTQSSPEQYLARWKANAVGVDLNRNFDADFGKGMQRTEPSSKLYSGKRSENQSESRALADYVRENDFDITVSYHAYGSEIYWEYGDNAAANSASKRLAQAVSAVTGYPLRGDSGEEGGGFKDWAIDRMGIPSITIEIGTRACPLPFDEFDSVWLRNKDVLNALCRYVAG